MPLLVGASVLFFHERNNGLYQSKAVILGSHQQTQHLNAQWKRSLNNR